MNTYLNNDNKGLLLVYVFSIQYFLLLLYNVVLLIKNTHCKTAHCVNGSSSHIDVVFTLSLDHITFSCT